MSYAGMACTKAFHQSNQTTSTREKESRDKTRFNHHLIQVINYIDTYSHPLIQKQAYRLTLMLMKRSEQNDQNETFLTSPTTRSELTTTLNRAYTSLTTKSLPLRLGLVPVSQDLG